MIFPGVAYSFDLSGECVTPDWSREIFGVSFMPRPLVSREIQTPISSLVAFSSMGKNLGLNHTGTQVIYGTFILEFLHILFCGGPEAGLYFFEPGGQVFEGGF